MSANEDTSTTHEIIIVLRVEFCLDVMAMLWFGFVFISLIYNFYFKKNSKALRINQFIRYTVLIYSCLYFISFITRIIMSIDEYSEFIKEDNLDYLGTKQFSIIYIINNTIWSMARISFFILWLGRHYYSFKNSIYQTNNIIYILLIICIFLMFLILMFVNIVIFSLGKVDSDSRVLLSLVLSFGILELIVSSAIIILFVMKLFKLILDTTKYEEIIDQHEQQQTVEPLDSMLVSDIQPHQEYEIRALTPGATPTLTPMAPESNGGVTPGASFINPDLDPPPSSPSNGSIPDSWHQRDENDEKRMTMSTMSLFKRWQSYAQEYDDDDDIKIKLEPKQIILINTIVQHSILGTIALVSAQIYVVMFLIYMFDFNFIENDFITNMMLSVYRPCDRIIQLICIYISLNFTHKWYKKLCLVCHNGCKRFCENIAKKKIQKRVIEKRNDSHYQLMLGVDAEVNMEIN